MLQPTEQMWREMLPQLRAFVRRRIADPDRADDLVAEILLRIHQNVGSLDDQERLPNWVFRIARNAIIDEYRRAARSREHLTATLQDEAAQVDEEEPGVVRELSACLRPILAGLPEEQRAAVEMIDLDGMSQADAAGARRGVAVRDEVPGAAWPSAPRRAARTVLRAHSRRSRSADGL